jgi:hypothetical protein
MAASDAACPSCGQPKAARAARPSSGSDDALQYVKIIGIMVVVIVVVVIIAGMMGPGAQPCGDCRGKKTVACQNCVAGRNLCRICKGHGFDPQTHSTCAECKGRGDTPACWKCGGKPTKTCPTCKGTGVHPE